MRSKAKARKLTRNEVEEIEEEIYDHEEPDTPLEIDEAPPPSSPSLGDDGDDDDDDGSEDERRFDPRLDQVPVYIPEDVVLPEQLELRESGVEGAGLGIFTEDILEIGEKYGPYAGVERLSVKDTQYAWEIVDEFGKVKCWVDANEPGTGNWMKYVRSAPSMEHQNMIAVQIGDHVYYKVVKQVEKGQELMVLKDTAFPDQDGIPLELMEKKFHCYLCDELFRSKVALRRHQKYVCNNHNAIFSTINNEFKQEQAAKDYPAALKLGPTENHSKYSPLAASSMYGIDKASSNGSVGSDAGIGGAGAGASASATSSGEREYKCDQCPKAFNWKSNLIRHQTSHDAEKKFGCENCDKVFTDPSNLQRHIRTQHIGARSHACPECGKTFATSSGLKQHTHIHSSIKPFTCEVCFKSYTQFSNLCRHKRMHADCRTQLKCTGCNQVFSTMTSLNKHRRFCHGQTLINGQSSALSLAWQQGLQSDPEAVPVGFNGGLHSHPSSLVGAARLGLNSYASLHLQHQSLLHNTLMAQSVGGSGGKDKEKSAYSAEEWLKYYTNPPLGLQEMKEKGKAGERQEKKGGKNDLSDLSEGSDISNVSTPTGSDLEISSGTDDLDSDSEGENGGAEKKQHKSPKLGEDGEKNKEDKKSSASTATNNEAIKAIASFADQYFNNNGLRKKAKEEDADAAAATAAEEKPLEKPKSKSQEEKAASPAAAAGGGGGGGGDQPLDLSLPRKRASDKDDEDEDDGAPEKKSRSFQSPLMVPPYGSKELTYARPMPFMMDPIYRVEKRRHPIQLILTDKLARYPYPYDFSMFSPFSKLNAAVGQKSGGSGGGDQQQFDGKTLLKLGALNKLDSAPGSNSAGSNALKTPQLYAGNGVEKNVRGGKDRYSCRFCGKVFPRSANLTRHLRTHTGEQPYSCKYCDRSFSISSNLQRHIRNIHNKEKPFKCPTCDRCFGQQTNLDRHLKKHENEKLDASISFPPDEREDEEEEAVPISASAPKESHGPAGRGVVGREFDTNFSITEQMEKRRSQTKSGSGSAGEDSSSMLSEEEAETPLPMAAEKRAVVVAAAAVEENNNGSSSSAGASSGPDSPDNDQPALPLPPPAPVNAMKGDTVNAMKGDTLTDYFSSTTEFVGSDQEELAQRLNLRRRSKTQALSLMMSISKEDDTDKAAVAAAAPAAGIAPAASFESTLTV